VYNSIMGELDTYIAEKFSCVGQFNGFPFLLKEKPSYITGEGIGMTGTRALQSTVNHYWNLQSIEAEFVIKTITVPAGYESGFAYATGAGQVGENLSTGHVVGVEYEIVDSFFESGFEPSDRQYFETTGESENLTVDNYGLINGSGSGYASCFVSKEPNFYVPITIQPDNTGAFLITNESGVAEYFQGLSDYGNYEKFEMNMMFDYGNQTSDEVGGEFNNIEYYSFPQTGYIIPKQGWSFEIEASKVKGFYYEYEYIEPDSVKPQGGLVINKNNPMKFIDSRQGTNLIGEPLPGGSSQYIDTRDQNGLVRCGLPGPKANEYKYGPHKQTFPKKVVKKSKSGSKQNRKVPTATKKKINDTDSRGNSKFVPNWNNTVSPNVEL
jgi:hypothetical protein